MLYKNEKIHQAVQKLMVRHQINLKSQSLLKIAVINATYISRHITIKLSIEIVVRVVTLLVQTCDLVAKVEMIFIKEFVQPLLDLDDGTRNIHQLFCFHLLNGVEQNRKDGEGHTAFWEADQHLGVSTFLLVFLNVLNKFTDIAWVQTFFWSGPSFVPEFLNLVVLDRSSIPFRFVLNLYGRFTEGFMLLDILYTQLKTVNDLIFRSQVFCHIAQDDHGLHSKLIQHWQQILYLLALWNFQNPDAVFVAVSINLFHVFHERSVGIDSVIIHVGRRSDSGAKQLNIFS